jgi:hypothetical protein
LTPAEVVDRKKVDKLLEDLHSEEFEERDKAQRGLEQLGDQIEPALRKALEVKPAPEVAKRIGELLRKFHDLPWSGKQLQAYRALEVLEHMRGEDAKSLMEKLAGGADGAWQTREAKAILERWQEADKK